MIEHVFCSASGFARDTEFLFVRWVSDIDEEHEAVELSFRERVGSFLLHRVLSREHEKWLIKSVGFTQHGHHIFLHRFQHSRLSLCRSTVDFIREHKVGEHWAFDELELTLASCCFLNDICAGNVRGHEVWSKLDTVKAQLHRFCHG